ncbi:MAG TPA: LacI family DNA-binding transcriptional regulator [Anaerolineae bacterium]|nr:LacI family DNA-binding transcriptional regulator [Anaerolineae bacterium]
MKRPTQADVAREAGVSRATVSYVVNGQTEGRIPISEDTRLRVLEAIEELDYEPDARAQALRSGSTNTIGFIIPDLRNPHFVEYATGIEQEARTAGYQMLLSSIALDEEYGVDIFKGLARRRIDGLIIASSFILMSEEAQKTLRQLRKRRLPIVELNDQYDVDCLVCDYREATNKVLAHLLSLHHRRIGMVYGVEAPEMADDRLTPYQETLKAAGLFDQELLMKCGPTIEDGYQAALQLLQRPKRPTALIAINDLLAIGVLRAAGDLGLCVPTDVSLVSYDDIPMAKYMVPRLTTISKDALHLGREAFKLLLERIKNPNRPRQRLVHPARFILRESTGPAPASHAPRAQ